MEKTSSAFWESNPGPFDSNGRNLRLLLWHRDVRSAQAIEKLLLLLRWSSVLFEGRHYWSDFECNDDLSGP